MVKIVVGVSPEDSGADAVALGVALAHLLSAEICLANVHPPTMDYPSVGRVDAEWAAFLHEGSVEVLEGASREMQRRWGTGHADRIIVANSSVSRGLREAARRVGASFIVTGSGRIGRRGHVVLGSTAHPLVHSAEVGIALAPQGFAESGAGRISRLVVGLRSDQNQPALQWSADVSERADIQVELLTVLVRVTRIQGTRLGRDPEYLIMQALQEQEEAAQAQAIASLGRSVAGVVAQGDTTEEAMNQFPWRSGDLFVLGSSRHGLLSRVLLGDTGVRLVRAAKVPVLVLPRDGKPD